MSSESALRALSLYYQESGFHTDIYSSEDLRCYFKESSCGCVAQATDFRSWSGGQFSKNPPSVWESRLNLPQALGQSLCQGGGGGSQLKWSIFSRPHSTPSYKALVVHQPPMSFTKHCLSIQIHFKYTNEDKYWKFQRGTFPNTVLLFWSSSQPFPSSLHRKPKSQLYQNQANSRWKNTCRSYLKFKYKI